MNVLKDHLRITVETLVSAMKRAASRALARRAARRCRVGLLFSPERSRGGSISLVVTLPFPDTPDQLIANFKTAYTGLDIGPVVRVCTRTMSSSPPRGRAAGRERSLHLRRGAGGSGEDVLRSADRAAWDTTIPAISAISIALLNRVEPGPTSVRMIRISSTRRALYPYPAHLLARRREHGHRVRPAGVLREQQDSVVSGVTSSTAGCAAREPGHWLEDRIDFLGRCEEPLQVSTRAENVRCVSAEGRPLAPAGAAARGGGGWRG